MDLSIHLFIIIILYVVCPCIVYIKYNNTNNNNNNNNNKRNLVTIPPIYVEPHAGTFSIFLVLLSVSVMLS